MLAVDYSERRRAAEGWADDRGATENFTVARRRICDQAIKNRSINGFVALARKALRIVHYQLWDVAARGRGILLQRKRRCARQLLFG
jgi:hypothetical protein